MERSATFEAARGPIVGYRDRQTRKTRWEAPDEDVTYEASDLDRNVVAVDQIRLILQTFRDKMLKETIGGARSSPMIAAPPSVRRPVVSDYAVDGTRCSIRLGTVQPCFTDPIGGAARIEIEVLGAGQTLNPDAAAA